MWRVQVFASWQGRREIAQGGAGHERLLRRGAAKAQARMRGLIARRHAKTHKRRLSWMVARDVPLLDDDRALAPEQLHDKLCKWLLSALTGNLEEVPGVGPATSPERDELLAHGAHV